MRKLFNQLFKSYYSLRMRHIERYMSRPFERQEGILKQLLLNARNTTWGKRYGYKSIKSPQQYAYLVPISNYEKLQPYINKMMHGERNVLWNGRVRWFSKSSGTTKIGRAHV